jgi:hypothetical protein
MPLRRCLDCPRLTTGTRCPSCTRAKDRKRGTTSARGYGWDHQQRKAEDEEHTTPADPCPRCGLPLGPPPWDQGHTSDRTGYEGPTHIRCNRNTARRNP